MKTTFIKAAIFILYFYLPAIQASAEDIRENVRETIMTRLISAIPDIEIEDIKSSGMQGMYKAYLGDGTFIYINSDGTDFFIGSHYKVMTNGVLNLTASDKKQSRTLLIESIRENLLVYKAADEKASITVFTDISCGYCKRFHQQVDELVNKGVTVKYAAYPRAGVGSRTFKDMRTVWCAKNNLSAMDRAMAGDNIIDGNNCDDPIIEHYRLGKKIGVQGTPTLVTNTGEMIVGYKKTDQLLKELGIN
jgi:thiol:disulfide interchange protein DsbC